MINTVGAMSTKQSRIGAAMGEVHPIPARASTVGLRGLFRPVLLCDSMNLSLGELFEDRIDRGRRKKREAEIEIRNTPV